MAAIYAICKAPDVVEKFSQAQSQSQCQSTTINNNHYIKGASEKVAKDVEKSGVDYAVDQIPTEPRANSEWPQSFYILPQYLEPLKMELEAAGSNNRKEQIILDYWNRSVNQPIKAIKR